jgi:transketolase
MKPPDTASTREAFIRGLMDVAAADPRAVLISVDSLKALRATPFAEKYPDRLFDLGIAEQSAVAFAAGLAASGLHPFVGGYAGFLTMKAFEQIRTFVAYPGLNVKFVGMDGGIHGGEREGATHQAFEDLAILRSIPGMAIVVPADAGQVQKAVREVAALAGPAYLRIGSGREPVIFEESRPFEFGRPRILDDHGSDAALFCCGPIVGRVLQAGKILAADGIGTLVVEVHTLKPLDAGTISAILGRTGAAVTIEDHSIIGGLGSAIAEVIAESVPAATLVRVGLRDIFPSSGESESLLDYYGMSVSDIVGAAKRAVLGKTGQTKPLNR